MNTYRILPDGDNELTLWRYTAWDDEHPEAVAQKCATHPVLWALAEELAGDTSLGGALRLSVAIALDQPAVAP